MTPYKTYSMLLHGEVGFLYLPFPIMNIAVLLSLVALQLVFVSGLHLPLGHAIFDSNTQCTPLSICGDIQILSCVWMSA